MNKQDQIERIKAKFLLAKVADKNCAIFGAGRHRYQLGKPVEEERIKKFEEEYKISLPEGYRLFIAELGCGGKNNTAGPYYGLYPFGKGIDDLVVGPEVYLSYPVSIHPNMSDEYWDKRIERIDADEDIPDEEYDQIVGELYGGILPIGSQGCTYIHGLVLHGAYRGKVVNLEMSLLKPHFTYEEDFLDWYERWLDEIISGELFQSSWFGHSIGGPEKYIISKYHESDDKNFKYECLHSLQKKKTLSPESIAFIEKRCASSEKRVKEIAFELLTKTAYEQSRSRLKELVTDEPLFLFKCIYRFARAHVNDWVEEINMVLSRKEMDAELFRFTAYIAERCEADLSHLIKPYLTHELEEIQTQAKHALEQIAFKQSVQTEKAESEEKKNKWSRLKDWVNGD